MKKLTRCCGALFFFVLGLPVLQTASAEGYLYLFKKDFPPGDFTAVEAVQEEKSEGNLKLTTGEGKLTVWQETLVAAKFPLFDEAKETPDPAALQSSIAAMEKYVEEEPGSKTYLQSLINQRKELQARLQNKTVETTQVTDQALDRYLGDIYSEKRNFSLEYLEVKLKRGEYFKQTVPDQAAKITEYLKPWEEELQNRKAGLERFDGKWLSAEAVAKLNADRIEAERKAFFEKEMVFSIPKEAISQNGIYIFGGVVAVSALIMLGILFHGLSNISQGFGLGAVLSLVFGLGGLGIYGYGAWVLFQKPPGFAQVSTPASPQLLQSGDTMPVDEFIFRINQSLTDKKSEAPSRYLLQDPALNTFLQNYLKVNSEGKTDAFAVTRKGLKVRVLADRILIFDELVWCKKELVACYTFFYVSNNQGFQIFKTDACVGGAPMPGKVFKFLWEEQIRPVVNDLLAKSKVFENYHVSRMESGMIELISNRNPPKVTAP